MRTSPDWPGVLTRWSVEPVVVVLLVAAVAAYGRGRREVQEGSPALFGAGVGVLAVALLSPLATYADALFSVHMVQHLLLVFAAAPLLVAAHPGPALRAGIPLRLPGLPPVVTSPVVAWLAFAATGWAVHFSPLFDLSLRSDPVHAAEHVLFFASGLLFWSPVLGRSAAPYPARLLYLGLAMPQNTFLALALYAAGHPLYATYGRVGRTWGPSLLGDQRAGGAVMWVAGDLTLLVAVLAVAGRWAGREAREAEEVADGQ